MVYIISLLTAMSAFAAFLPFFKRRKKTQTFTLVFCIVGILICTLINEYDKDQQEIGYNNKLISANLKVGQLTVKLDTLNYTLQKEHIKNREFENFLRQNFNIVRDSTNRARKITNTYNTKINTAQTVTIGGGSF